MSRRFADTMLSAGRKPRVLLVDDHREILDTVAAMLSDDFDVAGVATDGFQALDVARQVNPDVIVLDVDMPGLDGFRTFRALEQDRSPAAPVVFLSMHDAEEIVSEAFRCGGHGYVLKQRVGRDLVSALDQALLGRVFMPSLSSLLPLADGGLHAMQLYDDVDSFLDSLAVLFDRSLRRGDATCFIGDRRVRESLGDRLRAQGWDVGGSSGHRRYLAIDAATALTRFMRNDLPDPDRLAEIVAELDEYRRAESTGTTSRLTVCGSMAASLSTNGNAQAAIALERIWSRVTHRLPFLTVCGYATCCFHDGMPSLWSDVCAEHRALGHARDV